MTIKKGDIIHQDIKYRLDRLLDEGQFGKVFKSTTSIGRKIAIKIIDKSVFIDSDDEDEDLISIGYNDQLMSVQNEIDIHSQLKNINVINFEKMFQDNTYTYIYMILELSKSSLYDIIYEINEFISENDAIKII